MGSSVSMVWGKVSVLGSLLLKDDTCLFPYHQLGAEEDLLRELSFR